MLDVGGLNLESWTADYGDGSEPEAVAVPHAWRQDMPLGAEGPVVYRTSIDVPKCPCKLRFEGVSCAADVYIEGAHAVSHTGIWDAFDAPLSEYAGSRIDVSVSVIKNGGGAYPVGEVASGFLPTLFHSFGGIFREVHIVDADEPLDYPAPAVCRARAEGSRILVDDRPFYPRGLLHWGWYPEFGHTNPPDEVIRAEVQKVRELGFNLVKFCLWVPPQRYLEILKVEGMEAWLELPVWQPSSEPTKLARIAGELERIVRQYRRHDNILFWTVGCELGKAVSHDFRREMTRLVKNLTSAAFVGDDSGGAEVFGGDNRECGDFYDYHPYCDAPFYPQVLDQLLPGARGPKPLLLGEFNDADVHRDLARLGNEIPFWASNLAELNERGVRAQFDLPEVLQNNRFSLHPSKEHHRALMESSRAQALFMRKAATEAVRERGSISGYVVTGWRDTPITSAGIFDDWGAERFTAAECARWNGPACLFLLAPRRVPWTHGGNRPGLGDPLNQFTGAVQWSVGVHTERDTKSGLVWRVIGPEMEIVAQGAEPFAEVAALRSTEIGKIHWRCDRPGEYQLQAEFADTLNEWPISVVEPMSEADVGAWTVCDPEGVLQFEAGGGKLLMTTQPEAEWAPGMLLLRGTGTTPKPFWREAAYEFKGNLFWHDVPFAEQWSKLRAISGDRVIDVHWLEGLGVPYETLLRRIDVRTYQEDPVIVRFGDTIITTLRPYGGLGVQPAGIAWNAAGTEFVRSIARFLNG